MAESLLTLIEEKQFQEDQITAKIHKQIECQTDKLPVENKAE